MTDISQTAATAAADRLRPLADGDRRVRIPHDHYERLVNDRVATWAVALVPPTVAEIARVAEPDQPANRHLRAFMERNKLKVKDFDAALRREAACRALDVRVLPRTPEEYVAVLADRRGLTVRVNGVIDRDEPPWEDRVHPDGEVVRVFLRPDAMPPEQWAKTLRRFRAAPTYSEFCLESRTTAVNLRLGFPREAIDDAVKLWHLRAKRDRLEEVRSAILGVPAGGERASGEDALMRVARAYSDPARQSPEYFAAVLRKLIWQVKRKLAGLPVTDHAMPVLLGAQRGGKSTLVRDHLLAPVREITALTDFGQVTDSRNIELWSNYVLFLDEMQYASKSDIDSIKGIITAPTLTRRAMHSNGTDHVEQRATFVGAANKTELSDLLRDTSGMRRFLELGVAAKPDWNALAGVDWLAVWRAVDHEAADPMLPFADLVAERQEAARTRTHVEHWLETLGEDTKVQLAEGVPSAPWPKVARLGDGGFIPAMALFRHFRDWEDDAFPRAASSITRFGIDLAAAEPARFEKRTSKRGSDYRWLDTAPASAAVVPLRRAANEVA